MTPPHWRSDLALALAALLLLVAWEVGGADLTVTRWFGDAAGFAWQEHPIAQRVAHDGGRWLAWGLLGLLLWDAWRPWLGGPSRSMRLFAAAIVLLLALAVPALKQFSRTSCPWDLVEFGGGAAYVPHWLLGVADGGPGRCFPSGHAVAAFAFFALYFLWRPHRPVLARWQLTCVLALGAVYGLTQLVRGAHFVSHTLWTAWLCWCGAAMAFATVDAWRRRRAAINAVAATGPATRAAQDPPDPSPSEPRFGSPAPRPVPPASPVR